MLPRKEIKDIHLGEVARQKTIAGARKMYEVVSTTYGPAGYNVLLGMPFGDATLTRDGVTVAKRTILPDQAEDDAAQLLRQASERTNKTTGDGTTATIVLGYHQFEGGMKLIAAGENGMKIKKQLMEDSRKVIDFLKEQSLPGDKHLLSVATVSAGDPAIGQLISETLKDIGVAGGISIREQSYPTIDVEKVNGYLFDKGFFALNQQVEYNNPLIFVTQKQLVTNQDMIPLLSRVINGDNKNLIIIGDVRMNSDAMNTLLYNLLQGKLNAVVIPPPAYNDEAIHFLEDITAYVGSDVFASADDIKNIQDSHFGTAERVQVNQDRAIIFKGAGDTHKITDRISQIQQAIAESSHAHHKDQLEQRYAKLTGKIAIVNVGGSTLTEMEELRYRVEDSIEATKSAIADGVLPGGGTMLALATQLAISPLFKSALVATFGKLMSNAAESGEYRMKQILAAKANYGFNLRDMTDEPVDLIKAGVMDATRAVVQTIENATSAACSLLTVGAIVDPVPQKDSNEKTTA
jgi:chaperonin GroEL